MISDAAASGGQAVWLNSTGSAVRFSMPPSLEAGNYTVRIQARGEAFNGNPILALRLNGTDQGRVEVSTSTYQAFTVGTFALKPGDVLEVVFTNDAYTGNGQDRNAIIDALTLDPASTTSTATSASPTISGGTVDVKSFGAKGDGVTDDTAALNRAAAIRGKTILFSAGTYLVSRPVVFAGLSNQAVVGSGAVIKTAPGWIMSGSDLGVVSLRNVSNVTVKSLVVQGSANRNVSPWTNRMDGVFVRASTNVTVDGVEVREVQTVGINAENSSSFKVLNSKTIRVHGTGMGCGSCTNIVFSGNQIQGPADPNASMPNPNGGLGLMIQLGDTALIENNVITNTWDTATKTEGTSNVTYRGNTVDVYGKDGIKIQPFPQGGVNQVRNGIIENNTVRGFKAWQYAGSGGVLLQGVAGGRVSGNKIYGDGNPNREDNGIKLNTYNSTSRDIIVESNEVTDADIGLLLETENATTVRRNKFSSSGTTRNMKQCINVGGGSGSLIEDNTFGGFRGICTLFYNGTDNVTVQRNTYSSGDTGVFIDGNSSSGTRVLNNIFATSVARPLNLIGGVTCSGNAGNIPQLCR